MSLIIGLSDFGEIIKRKLGFIDKSLLIKEILDNDQIQVSVIVRPRRFGKTLNLSMLQHFLSPEVNMLKTEGLFDNLKIAQEGDGYMQHQGKYPVISMSFKNIKGSNFDTVYKELALLISDTYGEHRLLLAGSTLYDDEKETFNAILNRTASKEDLLLSLTHLIKYLHRYYKVKPWLLIDEYDTPIQEGYLNGYYKEIIEFMRGLFGSALKDNKNLHRAVVTGILRIAKENLFSGLNNLRVYSVLNEKYSEHFGFTQTEVDVALEKNKLGHLSTEIKAWYNGYQIGDNEIYNPWSIACCIEEKGALKPYWVNTSENTLIKKLLAESSADFKDRFELVLRNGVIETSIDESLVFSDLSRNENAIWGLLLFSGYLTAMSVRQTDLDFIYSLRSPNQEILMLYRSTVRHWFTQRSDESVYQKLLQSLVEGNLSLFLPLFQRILLESISYFDTSGQAPEKFYHGFVLGLVVSLSSTHIVHSNKESGFGRYDVVLIPKDKSKLGIVLEFKVAKPDLSLQDSAQEALSQIHQKNYTTELTQQGILKILTMGLAFSGKEVAMAAESNGWSMPEIGNK